MERLQLIDALKELPRDLKIRDPKDLLNPDSRVEAVFQMWSEYENGLKEMVDNDHTGKSVLEMRLNMLTVFTEAGIYDTSYGQEVAELLSEDLLKAQSLGFTELSGRIESQINLIRSDINKR